MPDLHIAPFQFLEQFDVVVAANAQGRSRFDHRHRQSQYFVGTGPPVDQVADEKGGPAGRRFYRIAIIPVAVAVFDHLVTKFLQQSVQFPETTVNVADDIERTG